MWIDEEKVRLEIPRLKNKETNKLENVEIYNQIRKAKRPIGKRLKKLILSLSQKRY
jgi:hypothetical protein